VNALCLQHRLHTLGGTFGHFKDGDLLRLLVVPINNGEDMPMLPVLEKADGY